MAGSMVTFTQNVLSVSSRASRWTAISSFLLPYMAAVRLPGPRASEMAAQSLGRARRIIPPHTIGYWIPSSSVLRVFITHPFFQRLRLPILAFRELAQHHFRLGNNVINNLLAGLYLVDAAPPLPGRDNPALDLAGVDRHPVLVVLRLDRDQGLHQLGLIVPELVLQDLLGHRVL